MDCPTEEQLIRNRLRSVAGIERLDFDLLQRQLTVSHRLPSAAPIRDAITSIGLAVESLDGASDATAEGSAGRTGLRRWWPLALSGVLAAVSEAVAWTTGDDNSWLVLVLVVASIALGGRTALRKGIGAVRARTLNINLLMVIAVVGAFLIGHWPEAAMVTFLFALAEAIEGQALDRARNAIRGLVELSPDVATVRLDGAWRELPSDQVAVGQTIRILPGERAPLDGIVVAGHSAMNQAPITGESMPVDKQSGDTVFAGTINADGPLEVRVTAAAGETTLDRIARSIQEAQAQRAPTQRFVDEFARYYTPAVVFAALLIAVVLPLLFGSSVYDSVYKALVLLVVACPCALVLATPVTVVSALTASARRGILVKGGAYMEQGHKLRAVAIDKTGTLTYGAPTVTDVFPLNGRPADEVLSVAASLNVHSTHPVARATVAAWQALGQGSLSPATDVRALVGRGVTGRLDGQQYFVGSHRLAEEIAVCSPAVEDLLFGIERAGKTAVVVGSDREPFGVLGVADGLRPTSRDAVQALLRRKVHVVMLTGDNEVLAQAVAEKVGITEVQAGLLPDDKLVAVGLLQERYGEVGMVGDGVNDAPAMARAAIGFAMGAAGTDTALETADVAFMDDDLRKLPEFLDISRRTAHVLRQNIVVAIGIKGLFFILTLMGIATLWMAVFADVGTSLLVVANGLRLLRGAGSSPGQSASAAGERSTQSTVAQSGESA
jgi:Cd2+/Zn2+-exporting ATPase